MNTGIRKIPRVLTYLVLCFWALTTIYPFIWVLLNSFRKKGPDPLGFLLSPAGGFLHLG